MGEVWSFIRATPLLCWVPDWQTGIPSLDTYARWPLALTHMLAAWQAYLALTLLSLDNNHLHVWRNKWHNCHYSLFQPPWQGERQQRPFLGIRAGEWMSAQTTSSGALRHIPNPILHATHPHIPIATYPFIDPNMCILLILKWQPHIQK